MAVLCNHFNSIAIFVFGIVAGLSVEIKGKREDCGRNRKDDPQPKSGWAFHPVVVEKGH